jgi:hypothetical protein
LPRLLLFLARQGCGFFRNLNILEGGILEHMLSKYRKVIEGLFVAVLLIYLGVRLSGHGRELENWLGYALTR